MWSLRNEELDGKTTATRAQAERREVDLQLTELYATRHFMEPQVEALLVEDQEKHMDQTVRAKTNWLAMAGPVIRRNVRKIRKASLQGVRSLRSYFPSAGDG
jgi:hypothetical protein